MSTAEVLGYAAAGVAGVLVLSGLGYYFAGGEALSCFRCLECLSCGLCFSDRGYDDGAYGDGRRGARPPAAPTTVVHAGDDGASHLLLLDAVRDNRSLLDRLLRRLRDEAPEPVPKGQPVGPAAAVEPAVPSLAECRRPPSAWGMARGDC